MNKLYLFSFDKVIRAFHERLFIFYKNIALDRLFGSFVLICFFCVEQAKGGNLSVSTLAPQNIQASKATYRGNILDSGQENPNILIYYGLADAGSDANGWQYVAEAGQKPQGEFSHVIGNLLPATTYYYRIRAYDSNQSDGVWASTSQNFDTSASSLPIPGQGSL